MVDIMWIVFADVNGQKGELWRCCAKAETTVEGGVIVFCPDRLLCFALRVPRRISVVS